MIKLSSGSSVPPRCPQPVPPSPEARHPRPEKGGRWGCQEAFETKVILVTYLLGIFWGFANTWFDYVFPGTGTTHGALHRKGKISSGLPFLSLSVSFFLPRFSEIAAGSSEITPVLSELQEHFSGLSLSENIQLFYPVLCCRSLSYRPCASGADPVTGLIAIVLLLKSEAKQ